MASTEFFKPQVELPVSISFVTSKAEHKPEAFDFANAKDGLYFFICAESSTSFDPKAKQALIDLETESVCFIKAGNNRTTLIPFKGNENLFLSHFDISYDGTYHFKLDHRHVNRLAVYFDEFRSDCNLRPGLSQVNDFLRAVNSLASLEQSKANRSALPVVFESGSAENFATIIAQGRPIQVGPFRDAEDFIEKLNEIMSEHNIKKYFSALPCLEDLGDDMTLTLTINKTPQTESALWGDYAVVFMQNGMSSVTEEHVQQIVARIESVEGFNAEAQNIIQNRIIAPLQIEATNTAEYSMSV